MTRYAEDESVAIEKQIVMRKGKPVRGRKARMYDFHGELITYSETAKRLGLSNESFRRKMLRWGFKRAVELTEQRRRSDRDYAVFGNAVKTITEWCRIFGMKDTTVFSRIKGGWEIHAALATPSDIKHTKRRDSLSEVAREHNMKMGTLWARRNRHGMKDGEEFQPLITQADRAAKGGSTQRRNRMRRQLAGAGIII